MAKAPAGFSLIETMVVVVVLGMGLGGVWRLLTACVRSEGETRARMRARVKVMGALEPGAGAGEAALVRVQGRWEARVVWTEGERVCTVRLGRWEGRP